MQPDDILNQPFSKIILSNKIDKSFAYNKAVIVPIQWRNKQKKMKFCYLLLAG